MFDEGQHHPKWSFVRGWNERRCTCAACLPALQFRQQPTMAPYLPVMQPQPAPSPYFYGDIVRTTSGTTNVK